MPQSKPNRDYNPNPHGQDAHTVSKPLSYLLGRLIQMRLAIGSERLAPNLAGALDCRAAYGAVLGLSYG